MVMFHCYVSLPEGIQCVYSTRLFYTSFMCQQIQVHENKCQWRRPKCLVWGHLQPLERSLPTPEMVRPIALTVPSAALLILFPALLALKPTQCSDFVATGPWFSSMIFSTKLPKAIEDFPCYARIWICVRTNNKNRYSHLWFQFIVIFPGQ